MRGAILGFVCAMGAAAPAAAWDPFLVENGEVADGNERMAARDAQTALHHYDQAARQLPNAPGVHLDRGLALLEADQLDEAIEAFERASQPPATREIRADAHYDIGIAQYRQADAAATAEDHEEAQRLFRAAADSFRQSLRLRPGNADAGWNLELALRRLREQEEQQEQQEQQDQEQQDQEQQDQEQQDQEQQDQEQQDQEQQDQEQQDQEPGDEEPQDQEPGDEEPQDQEPGDEEPQDQEPGDEEPQDQEPGDEEGDESSDEEEGSEDPSSQEGGRDGEGDQAPPQDPRDEQASGSQDRSLPPEHRRVLDALQDSEQNLERHRARTRAARENRRVEQDW